MVARVSARGPSDDAVEHRADHVLGALADLVADLAFGEDLLPGGGILRRRGANRSQERRPGNRKTQQLHIPLRIWVIPMPPVGERQPSRERSSLSNWRGQWIAWTILRLGMWLELQLIFCNSHDMWSTRDLNCHESRLHMRPAAARTLRALGVSRRYRLEAATKPRLNLRPTFGEESFPRRMGRIR